MWWKQTGMCEFSLDVCLSHKHLVFSAGCNAKSRQDSCGLSPPRRPLCFTALHSPEREPQDDGGVTAETLFMSSVVSDAPTAFHLLLWMDYIWSRCVLLFSLSDWTCWETRRPLLIYCTAVKKDCFQRHCLQHRCPPLMKWSSQRPPPVCSMSSTDKEPQRSTLKRRLLWPMSTFAVCWTLLVQRWYINLWVFLHCRTSRREQLFYFSGHRDTRNTCPLRFICKHMAS